MHLKYEYKAAHRHCKGNLLSPYISIIICTKWTHVVSALPSTTGFHFSSDHLLIVVKEIAINTSNILLGAAAFLIYTDPKACWTTTFLLQRPLLAVCRHRNVRPCRRHTLQKQLACGWLVTGVMHTSYGVYGQSPQSPAVNVNVAAVLLFNASIVHQIV